MSLFSNLLNQIMNLFGSQDASSDKKRLLKKINTNLSQTKLKFYKYNSDEVLPALAKCFFDFYKVIGPTQSFFRNPKGPNYFKHIVINYFLNDTQKDIELRLNEDSIFELAKKVPLKETNAIISKDLSTYMSFFTEDTITAIDNTYTQLSNLIDFCSFDYFFLLKKFDSTLQEENYKGNPHFATIRAEYIVDDLKDFIEVAWKLDLDADWGKIFTVLKAMANIQPISLDIWNKVLLRLRKLHSLGVFEMMIQLISKDPGYKPVIVYEHQSIIDSYLNSVKKNVEDSLHKIRDQQKSSKIETLLTEIFGTTSVIRLKYYSDETTAMFAKKSIAGYSYSAPLNYLKAFLNDYYKKDVREFADLVLVRGQWTSSSLSNPMSETYHYLLSLSESITIFDENLGDEGMVGMKIKTYFGRADRDREAKNILVNMIKEKNHEAQTTILEASKSLVIVAKYVKMLLEDMERKSPEVLINWSELVHFSDKPIKDMGVEVYKKIFHFVTLMKFFLSKDS